jgi:hypothetical protein
VVVVQLPEEGRGQVMLNPAAGAGATVVVVAMEASAAFIIECIPMGSESGCSS